MLKEDRGGPDNDDMMMLMANMLAHERPDPRTPLPKDLHFSFEVRFLRTGSCRFLTALGVFAAGHGHSGRSAARVGARAGLEECADECR